MGKFPEISLALAREKHSQARKLLLNNVNPNEFKQILKLEIKRSAENTFEAINKMGA